ncbi:MAG: hypothetical protein ABH881_04310 [bacterium]
MKKTEDGFTMIVLLLAILIIATLYFFGNDFIFGNKSDRQNFDNLEQDVNILRGRTDERNLILNEEINK